MSLYAWKGLDGVGKTVAGNAVSSGGSSRRMAVIVSAAVPR